MAAAPQPREATPPPVIGKAGRYTVFITPPATPKPQNPSPRSIVSPSTSPGNSSPFPAKTPPPTPPSPLQSPSPRSVASPSPAPRNGASFHAKVSPPPVQVPPQQFDKPAATRQASGSAFGFFWNAIAKVQDAHSSLDEHLADWFGLNQSKYQWALNDYYQSKDLEKENDKQKESSTKAQVV